MHQKLSRDESTYLANSRRRRLRDRDEEIEEYPQVEDVYSYFCVCAVFYMHTTHGKFTFLCVPSANVTLSLDLCGANGISRRLRPAILS